jgi:fucose permease
LNSVLLTYSRDRRQKGQRFVDDMKRSPNSLTAAIAFLAFIVMGFNAGILGVAWPSVRDTFGVSQDAIGALLMLSTVGALAMNVSSGHFITNIGLGPLLVIGCVIAGVAYLGYAWAPTWWILVFFGFASGIGTTGLVAGLNTYFAISQSARLMIWLQACFGLGAIFSPTMMARLLDTGYSWRWAYISIVLLLGGLAVGFALTLERWRIVQPAPAEAAADSVPETHSNRILKLPVVWLSLLLFFTLTGMEGSAAQWPYTLFTESRSITPHIAGLWVSVFWASVTVGRIFFGVVVNRVRAVPLVRLTMSAVICGTALLWWDISNTLTFLGFTVIGFALSPLFPVLTSNTPKRIGVQHAAEAIGFQLASTRLGLAAIPALGGLLAAAHGLEIIGPFLFAVSITLFLVHEATLLATPHPNV